MTHSIRRFLNAKNLPKIFTSQIPSLKSQVPSLKSQVSSLKSHDSNLTSHISRLTQRAINQPIKTNANFFQF